MTKRWSEKLSSLWVPSEIWFSIYPNPWSNPTVSSSTVRRRRRRFGEDPSRRATRGRRELSFLQNEKKKMTDHSLEFHPSRYRQRIAIDGEIEERGRKKRKYGFRRKPRRRRESSRIGPIRSSHVGVPTNPKNAKLITGSLLSFYFSFIVKPLFFWNPLLELPMELLLAHAHEQLSLLHNLLSLCVLLSGTFSMVRYRWNRRRSVAVVIFLALIKVCLMLKSKRLEFYSKSK